MVRIRTSFFGLVKDIDAVARAGYDCIEMHISEIMALDDSSCAGARKKIRDSGLTSEVFDNPLPLDKIIADPGFDMAFYTDYVKKAMDRIAGLGARYAVYGNGKTRSATSSLDLAKNDEMLDRVCKAAEENNITILLEPLASQICNRFLCIPEIFEYAKTMGFRNMKTLVDYRWFLAGGHSFQTLCDFADFIQHVHIDNPDLPFPARKVPAQNDGHDYSALFSTLKKLCYKGIISIEANTFDDFEGDMQKGLELFAAQGIIPYKT
jgi:sugar phosphate isomerase/epimerase